MRTVHSLKELRTILRGGYRQQGKTIGLVPTMGNLHEGHISLVRKAAEASDIVVTSIFVNPMQFGANEDLDTYPRTLVEDQEKLAAAGNTLVFAPPGVEEIYPEGLANQTKVVVPEVSEGHCGASRPGHFEGVATVVTMLFNMVQPDIAVFGEKDFQQLAVIRKLARDLMIPVEVIGARRCGKTMAWRKAPVTAICPSRSGGASLRWCSGHSVIPLTSWHRDAPTTASSSRRHAMHCLRQGSGRTTSTSSTA